MFNHQTAPLAVLGLLASVSLVAGCGHVIGAKELATGALAVRGTESALVAQHLATPDDDAMMAGISNSGPVSARLIPVQPSTDGGAPKPAVLSMPSPNFGPRSLPIDTLIMHHTSSAADAQHIGSFFSQKAAGVSAHYTVGKDGTIVQSVPDNEVAWHAGVSAFLGRNGVNAFSLGIEMCNVGDGVDPYTDAQYKALGQLVAYILDEHHIKWDHVTGHKDIALPKGRKDDPSPNFDYDRMKAEVAAVDPNAGM